MYLTPLMRKAIIFATKAHTGQKDKSGVDYIAHPYRVAMAVYEHGEIAFAIAMCHDVVEDCGVTLDQMEAEFAPEFGDYIAHLIRDGVDAVSRRVYPDGTKEQFFVFVRRSREHFLGRIVKIADVEDNSHPDRLLALPEAERGIATRYAKALEILV
jgi:(p)ppGpp synthase/HD superfamily hydrolase